VEAILTVVLVTGGWGHVQRGTGPSGKKSEETLNTSSQQKTRMEPGQQRIAEKEEAHINETEDNPWFWRLRGRSPVDEVIKCVDLSV